MLNFGVKILTRNR